MPDGECCYIGIVQVIAVLSIKNIYFQRDPHSVQPFQTDATE
jgi:hypothetical protein